MHGNEDGETGVDDDVPAQGFASVGAYILGRNMFGPVRGPWPDDSWKGWWGEEPPYHVPVFVLTHHARAPLEMKGGTTFYFVSDGAESALKQAKVAAQGKDVRIGGGVATIRQYLAAGQIDEMAFADALYTAGMPDPDLLIRTAGEMRISNFLLWQISYAELWVTQKCWPDFDTATPREALRDYAGRTRRFGGLNG